ncbi:MAG: signal peptidase I, partial [Verrucomicrobia bacterium]|nr:signal peptidase I [Verrucomicrobiota bacterium]
DPHFRLEIGEVEHVAAVFRHEADLLARHSRRVIHHRLDLLGATPRTEIEKATDELEAAVRTKQPQSEVEAASGRLEKILHRHAPLPTDASWRENVEVILVAIVLAVALRAYFVQPFRIPTGSMEPTLNGILGHPLPRNVAEPNFFSRAFQSLALGRTYVEAVSPVADRVERLVPVKRFRFMDYTRIECASGRNYTVHAALTGYDGGTANVRNALGLRVGKPIEAGEPILRGYIDTGDQVFVDKFTYHFRRPRRGDVFVFRTTGIHGIEVNFTDPDVRSQFYIKRLAGLPNDTLRIDAPRLFINDELAQGYGFERVMSGTQQAPHDGYSGYANMNYPGRNEASSFHFLRTPEETFRVPDDGYFALGDNSYNSSDSRVWGKVPQNNIVGRGLWVYWPLGSHWGKVR